MQLPLSDGCAWHVTPGDMKFHGLRKGDLLSFPESLITSINSWPRCLCLFYCCCSPPRIKCTRTICHRYLLHINSPIVVYRSANCGFASICLSVRVSSSRGSGRVEDASSCSSIRQPLLCFRSSDSQRIFK